MEIGLRRCAPSTRIAHETLKGSWLDAPDASLVARRLDGGGFTHLAVVHHETTTGRLTDIKTLSRVCAVHGVQLLLDGVSSFGAEAIDFADAGLVAVAATAKQVPARGAGSVLRDHPARGIEWGRESDLLSGPRASGAPAGPAQHAVHCRPCTCTTDCGGAARIPGAGRAGLRALSVMPRLRNRCASGLAALGIEALLTPQESSVVLRGLSSAPGSQLPGIARCAQGRRFRDLCGSGRSLAHLVPYRHDGGDCSR